VCNHRVILFFPAMLIFDPIELGTNGLQFVGDRSQFRCLEELPSRLRRARHAACNCGRGVCG
jgi:hypothetical protein